LATRLAKLSASTRRPKATYIREALEHEIDRIEWEQGILKQSEDYRAGRLHTITQDEMEKSLGLVS